MSILDAPRRDSEPTAGSGGSRHSLCIFFDGFLDAVLADQAGPNSYAFRVLEAEFGTSVTASIMQAADIRRLRKINAALRTPPEPSS